MMIISFKKEMNSIKAKNSEKKQFLKIQSKIKKNNHIL